MAEGDQALENAMYPQNHAHFDLEAGRVIDEAVSDVQDHSRVSPDQRVGTSTSIESDPGASKIPISPILKRRMTRSATVTTFKTQKSPTWHPGQEPGLDPSKPNGGRSQSPMLHEECQITVVDFSPDDMEMHDFDNEGLINFIQKPQESWIKCRWINVNGLSWDVIQALGKYKNLHRLAIEDLINTDNRTKADW